MGHSGLAFSTIVTNDIPTNRRYNCHSLYENFSYLCLMVLEILDWVAVFLGHAVDSLGKRMNDNINR